jgi:hypothetical protein
MRNRFQDNHNNFYFLNICPAVDDTFTSLEVGYANIHQWAFLNYCNDRINNPYHNSGRGTN